MKVGAGMCEAGQTVGEEDGWVILLAQGNGRVALFSAMVRYACVAEECVLGSIR